MSGADAPLPQGSDSRREPLENRWMTLWKRRFCGGKVWMEGRIAVEMRHSIRKLSTYSYRPFLLSVPVTTVKGSDRKGRCTDASLTRTGRRDR